MLCCNRRKSFLTSEELKGDQWSSSASHTRTKQNVQQDKFVKIREVDCANLAKNWPHTEFPTKIKTFLAKLRTTQPNNNEHGISWLELAMLFEFRSGTLIPNDLGKKQDPTEHFPKPIQFKRISQNFSTARKRVLDATPGGRSQKQWWLACAATG